MNTKNDIVYSLLLKPKDWTEDQQKLFVTILHPKFIKIPMVWRYALGIPYQGANNVVIYAGFNWNEKTV